MTIIYQYRVASTSLGGFLKLLAAWRGSIYKLLYKETFIFGLLYTAISLTYRLALTPTQKRQMESVVIHCNSYTSLIPISFVLGFYVTIVVQRWWQQFRNVPWPDRTLFVLCTYLNGQEERSRIMRRTVARYMMFGLLLIMRSVSVAVMKRFPTIDTIVEAGFITKEEADMYESTQCRYLKFWVPLMWANNVIARARREGRIETEFGLRMILEQLADFRDKCSLCFVYDWITIPLVYTQVVTLAVYSFFAASLLGRQFLDPARGYPGYEYDSYVPVFTLLQFTFYMGWLKVAEQMINPFGEDDDDYDINWLLDRHTAVAFALVDQCCGRHPPLVRDQFWDEEVMPEMPYTMASEGSRRPNFLGSTFNINHLNSEDQKLVTAPESDRLRRRSHGSFAGSVLSLFSFKHHNRLLSGSRDTIDSGEHHGRFLSIPNGRAGYTPLPQSASNGDKSRSISLDMTGADEAVRLAIPERRERSHSERADGPDAGPRIRKLSSPSRFNVLSKRDSHIEPTSPKPSRFTVEAVEDNGPQLSPLTEEGGGVAPRTRRSGQHVLSVLQAASNKAVSRPPLLSAIEEGNTVTSLRQILPRSDSETSSMTSTEDLFTDVNTSGLEDISEDHRETELAGDHGALVTHTLHTQQASASAHHSIPPSVTKAHDTVPVESSTHHPPSQHNVGTSRESRTGPERWSQDCPPSQHNVGTSPESPTGPERWSQDCEAPAGVLQMSGETLRESSPDVGGELTSESGERLALSRPSVYDSQSRDPHTHTASGRAASGGHPGDVDEQPSVVPGENEACDAHSDCPSSVAPQTWPADSSQPPAQQHGQPSPPAASTDTVTHPQRGVPHPPSTTDRGVPHPSSITQRQMPHPPSTTQHEMPHPPSTTQHEVLHPPSTTDRGVPHPSSITQRQMPHPPSTTQHEMPHPPSSTQHEVPHPPSTTQHEMPHPPSSTQHEMPHPPSTTPSHPADKPLTWPCTPDPSLPHTPASSGHVTRDSRFADASSSKSFPGKDSHSSTGSPRDSTGTSLPLRRGGRRSEPQIRVASSDGGGLGEGRRAPGRWSIPIIVIEEYP